jgi:hypothetical protein
LQNAPKVNKSKLEFDSKLEEDVYFELIKHIPNHYEITTQVEDSKYRIDQVLLNPEKQPVLAIEIDGDY